MSHMQAVTMTSTGLPEVLRYSTVPRPEITTSKDVLVKLKAASVNPVDAKLRNRGTYFPDMLPTILGCDGAGIIEEVGAAVTQFKTGDSVYFYNGGIGSAAGNYAQYTVVKEQYLALKPQTLSFIEAAAAPLVLITAWESLYDRGNMKQGDEVLIHAGAGGVGHVALQLAKIADTRVVTTVSSEQKREFVNKFGVDLVVDYNTQDFVTEIAIWSRSKGVRLALDPLGGRVMEKTFNTMQPYGDLITLLQPDANIDWKMARNKNLRVSFELMLMPMISELQYSRLHQTRILKDGAKLFEENKLKIHVDKVFPLAKAAEAHSVIEQGHTQGKIVLEIS